MNIKCISIVKLFLISVLLMQSCLLFNEPEPEIGFDYSEILIDDHDCIWYYVWDSSDNILYFVTFTGGITQYYLKSVDINTNEVNILESGSLGYLYITTTRDKNFIYFVHDNKEYTAFTLHRYSYAEGKSELLLSDVNRYAVSPDGKNLIFTKATHEAVDSIFLYSVDRRDISLLSVVDGKLSLFRTFSPDGKFILFEKFLSEHIFMLSLENSVITELLHSYSESIHWIEDDIISLIVKYTGDHKKFKHTVFLKSLLTGFERKIGETEKAYTHQHLISHNLKYFIYYYNECTKNVGGLFGWCEQWQARIYRVDIDTKKKYCICTFDKEVSEVSISPDDKSIVFRNLGNRGKIYILRV